MKIQLQKMNDFEIQQSIPVNFNERLNHAYIVDILKRESVDKKLISSISENLKIDKLFLYMHYHHLMQDNIISHCNEYGLKIYEIFKKDSYIYARINIENTKDFVNSFPLIDLITFNMEDITVYSVDENLEVSTIKSNSFFENTKPFTIRKSEMKSITIFVPDDVVGCFNLYSNDEKFNSDYLNLLFPKMMHLLE